MYKKPWSEINIKNWKDIPYIKHERATKEDVESGRAVFFTPDDQDTVPYEDLPLPCCAIHREDDSEHELPVIAIQAEIVNEKILVGYRMITGGNGICVLSELEILDGPDSRFVSPT